MIGDRPFPLLTGMMAVETIERPTPRLARITFSGGGVDRFPDDEPGEIVTLLWAGAGRDEPVLPGEGYRFPEGRPDDQHERNFTVRALDREAGTLTVDFVIHGNGRACRWASSARPGDRIGFAGPRVHFFADDTADWTLLAGDETALPSIAATLERLPPGHRTLVFVEVADAGERQVLDTPAAADVRWVERGGQPAGRSRRLAEAVMGADLPEAGTAKVWVAGESLAIRPIREYLKRDRGYTIGPMQAIGYWRHRDTPEDLDEES